jgi:hypothetical protein
MKRSGGRAVRADGKFAMEREWSGDMNSPGWTRVKQVRGDMSAYSDNRLNIKRPLPGGESSAGFSWGLERHGVAEGEGTRLTQYVTKIPHLIDSMCIF